MIAIDDTLITEVVKIFIKKEPITYNNRVQKLLRYISPPIVIGSFQIKDPRALSQSQGLVRFINAQNELELAKKSRLKLILSNNNSNYPYININSDEFESNYTATYQRDSNKQKVLEHLKNLIESGDRVEIYDRYLFYDNGDSINLDTRHNSVNIISQFTRNQNITFEIFCKRGDRKADRRILNFNQSSNINFTHRNLNKHDRYIKVYKDNTLIYEIILSSGLYNILGNSDFTYIVRV